MPLSKKPASRDFLLNKELNSIKNAVASTCGNSIFFTFKPAKHPFATGNIYGGATFAKANS